jgi:hypothetical protein
LSNNIQSWNSVSHYCPPPPLNSLLSFIRGSKRYLRNQLNLLKSNLLTDSNTLKLNIINKYELPGNL